MKRYNCSYSYFVLLIKIISSVAFLELSLVLPSDYIGMLFIPFCNVALFYSFALAYDPKYTILAIAINSTAIIAILLALVTMILGIVFRRLRRASSLLITLTALIDFIVSFFVGNNVLKILCIIVSAIMLLMCLRSLKKSN